MNAWEPPIAPRWETATLETSHVAGGLAALAWLLCRGRWWLRVADPAGAEASATWRTAGEAVRVVRHWSHLRHTGLTALIVGTVLFAINHLDTVLAGQATSGTWVKVGVTYLVPFVVANVGLLLGSRRSRR